MAVLHLRAPPSSVYASCSAGALRTRQRWSRQLRADHPQWVTSGSSVGPFFVSGRVTVPKPSQQQVGGCVRGPAWVTCPRGEPRRAGQPRLKHTAGGHGREGCWRKGRVPQVRAGSRTHGLALSLLEFSLSCPVQFSLCLTAFKGSTSRPVGCEDSFSHRAKLRFITSRSKFF